MKERPIIFNTPMVRAILEGRKTQTRRVLRERHFGKTTNALCLDIGVEKVAHKYLHKCPYGAPGDRLWVRETWAVGDALDDIRPSEIRQPIEDNATWHITYKATPEEWCVQGKWRPSIFMPRWASRILLEVTEVRVERVQGMNEEDAVAEGILREDLPPDPDGFHPPGSYGYVTGLVPFPKGKIYVYAKEGAFRELWDSINAKRGFGWDVNPWVWVVTFKWIRT